MGVPLKEGRFRPSPSVGVSDLIAIKSGRFVAIECKTGTGKLTPHQKIFLDSVAINGGLSIVARSVGDVESALNL